MDVRAVRALAGLIVGLTLLPCAKSLAQSRPEQAPYPVMAPLARYMMPMDDEITLARSAAPKSISDKAEIMVLAAQGYVVAAKGSNGFLCIVERAWANATSDAGFWNPKMRAPNCFNAAAAGSFALIYLMKTRLVLEGKSRPEIARAIAAAFQKNELPALAPNAMCYMMSKQQYLNDIGKNWHPHVMIFAPGDAAKTWGANLPGSPIISANDPEEHVTIFMIWADHWSDGTPYAKPPQPEMHM